MHLGFQFHFRNELRRDDSVCKYSPHEFYIHDVSLTTHEMCIEPSQILIKRLSKKMIIYGCYGDHRPNAKRVYKDGIHGPDAKMVQKALQLLS